MDGQIFTRRVRALTVGDALSSVQVSLALGDRLSPPANTWLWDKPAVRIDRAIQVAVAEGTEIHNVLTTEKIAANVVELAGLRLFPGDQVLLAPLQGLITHQVDIRPIREALLVPGSPVSSLLTNLWEEKKGKYGPRR